MNSTFLILQRNLGILGIILASIPAVSAQDVVINGDVDPGSASSPVWEIPGNLTVGNTGSGTLEISGTGSVSGNRISIGASLGAVGGVTISGGRLASSDGVIVGNDGGNGTLTISGSSTVESNGLFIGASGIGMGLVPVHGGTGLVQMSGGRLTLHNATDGDGGTVIGSIMVGVSGYYINYPDVLNPVPVAGTGTLEISGGEVSAGAMYVAFSNAAGGTGIVKATGGTVTLGELTLGQDDSDPFNATLEISGSASVTSGVTTIRKGASSIVKMSGGSWDAGFTALNGTLELSGGALTSGTVISNGEAKVSGGTWAMSGDFYNFGNLEISEAGAVSSKNGLIGANLEHDSTTRVSDGTWNVSETLDIGYFGRSTLEISGSGSVSVQSKISVGYWADSIGVVKLLGGTLGTGKLEKGEGSGTIIFDGGVLKALRDEGDFLSGFAAGDVQIQSGGAIFDTNGHNILVGAALSGTGALAKRGAGILALSGSNSYSGGTIIESGTLQLGHAAALGSAGGSLALHGGILDLNGHAVAVGLLSGSAGTAIRSSVSGTASLAINQNSDSTYAGNIQNGTGVVHLTKEGTGTLTLSGSNSYSGGTTITAGTLAVRSNHSTTFGTLGSGTTTVQGGGSIGQSGGALAFLDSADAGAGAFEVDSGAAFAAAGGLIRFADTSTAGSGLFINHGAHLAGAAFAVTRFEGSSSAGSATLIANGGSNGGLGGVISFVGDSSGGTSQVELYGNGGLAISLHNPGSVAIGSLAGEGQVVLGSNNLALGGNNLSTTFSGVIEGAGGSLTKEGTGTLNLLGVNTYSGRTLVSAGTLLVNGSLTASEVTVQSGGALGGAGVITNLILEEGSILTPGNSIGTLSLDTLIWSGGAELLFELGASTSDRLSLSGELSKGDLGIFNFTFENSDWQIGQTYTLIEFGSTNFDLEDFGFTNGGGFDGYFELTDNSLNFTLNVIPEPSTWGLLITGLLLSSVVARRRSRGCRAEGV